MAPASTSAPAAPPSYNSNIGIRESGNTGKPAISVEISTGVPGGAAGAIQECLEGYMKMVLTLRPDTAPKFNLKASASLS